MSVVVITGANSGFGLAAAIAFARNGDTVVATMRDVGKSRELDDLVAEESLPMDIVALDITNSENFDSVVDRILTRHGRLDVLVNNAGIHRAGSLEDVSEQAFRDVMETNCTGPLMLARAVLPHMRKQGEGLIIMMSSLSGIAGLPGDLPYSASKFAIEGATEALRHEVDRWGIRVALVEAGMYRTSIMNRNLPTSSLLPEDYPADSPYRALIEWQLANLRQRMPEAMDPAIVARLFVEIAGSEDSQLRWPADDIAARVLDTMFAQSDSERDEFLQNVAGSNWWSKGEDTPTAGQA